VNPGTLIRIPIMFEQGRHSDCGIGWLFGVFMKDLGYMLSRSQSKGARSTYKLLTGFNWPDGGHRINLGSPDA